VTTRAPRAFAAIVSAGLLLWILPALPAPAPIHLNTIPTAGGIWLDRLNAWRASTGLPALSEDTTWSQGDYDHAVYMVQTDQVTHYELTSYPQYTVAGDTAARNGNIEVSSSTSTTDDQAIDWWMKAPFHAIGMMDPRLMTTGFGSYRQVKSGWDAGFALDVLRGNTFTGGTYPVYFPGNGSTEPLTTYAGGEFPDPLQGCPGYSAPTGLPVFIQVGGNVATSAGAVHSFTGNGTPLAHCVIDSNNSAVGSSLYTRGGVIVIPQQPLQTGVKYVVALTVNSVPYTWSFTVGPLISAPGAPSNVSATAGDATATVTWSAPTYDGGSAVTSYKVTPYIGTTAQTPQTVTAPTTAAVFSGLTNGTTYWFTVAATNSVGTGAAASSYSVTPTSTATPPARSTASSLSQYSLPNSDGVTWQDVDGTNLSLSVTPTANTMAIVTGNSDFWTANTGFNQDLGIWMSPTTSTAGIVAWKESGGAGGTFSPNAAAVQTVVPLTASITYSFKLRWKTNQPAMGATIYAGAGPLTVGGISPTRLTIQLVPAANLATGVSTQQYTLANSDGSTWQPIDATNLIASVSPTATSTAIVTANSDLWTASAGFNQDIAIFVSVNGGADQLVAWKESGGSAGTFSPNAAFVQAAYAVSSGNTYAFRLKWKANRSASGATIVAGAGPIGGAFSPTRLTVQLVSNAWEAASTKQYSVANNDGSTWVEVDPAGLEISVAPSSSATLVVGANADLWTANAGFNQDLGIFVSVNGGADQLVAWKESGGFAGTFSPNAAFVQGVYAVTAGSTYVFKVKLKANKSAGGATIVAGAGPIGGAYSPTSLIAQILT